VPGSSAVGINIHHHGLKGYASDASAQKIKLKSGICE
jgi:hypothetical protein